MLPLLFLFLSTILSKTVHHEFTIDSSIYSPVDSLPPRLMLLVNKQYPGPTITLELFDVLLVRVHNRLNESTSLHWHGMFQRHHPWMDGPPGANQCAIPPNATFEYRFKVTQSGTYWWHAHTRAQYADGIFGKLIIRDRSDPYRGQYTREHTLLMNDYYANNTDSLRPYYLSPSSMGNEPVPDAALIDGSQHGTRITVKSHDKVLLRLINGGAFSVIRFSIDNCTMQLVEADGVPLRKSAHVQQVVINVGQRYSVLVHPRVGTVFRMRASLESSCYAVPLNNSLMATGLLVYGRSIPGPIDQVHQALTPDCVDMDSSLLKPIKKLKLPATVSTSLQFIISFASDDQGINRAYLNNVSFTTPRTPTLFSILQGRRTFNPPSVYLVNRTGTVELVLVNTDSGEHPFHLHGVVFAVVASGNGTDATNAVRDLIDPPIRDTYTVPASSYVIIRFLADNPGVWLFHCHIQWHVMAGLVAHIVVLPDEIERRFYGAVPDQVYDHCLIEKRLSDDDD